MKKENLYLLIGLIIILAAVVAGFFVIKSMSGVDPPFTVIESESMQHSNESEVGIIDTGDMILVKSPDKTDIVSLVEGYATKEKHFGDYGSVIIYNRGNNQNPVIHRAILYLEHNSNNTWNAPSLENYDLNWEINGSKSSDTNNLHGILTLELPGDYRSNNKIEINLDQLQLKNSYQGGYITMGDNNPYTDQQSGICDTLVSVYDPLISDDDNSNTKYKNTIKSVAWKEIPWLGAIKLAANGKLDNVTKNVPNTIPNLIMFVFTIILILYSLGFVYDLSKSKRKETPTPSFPLQQEKE